MKQLHFLIALLLCVFFSNAQSAINQRETTSLFAFNFFKSLQQASSDTANIFVSPISLQMNLSMLLNGANGRSYTQLQKVLNSTNLSTNDINSECQALLKDLPDIDKQVQIGFANSVWYSNQLSMDPSYSKTVNTYFGTDIYPAQFSSSTTDSINAWASNKTNGKIKLGLKPIDINDEIIMLINVLYFKGRWALKFDKSNTAPNSFTLENGKKKQVMMMTLEDSFYYFSNTKYSVLRLPYGNGNFSMTILLPGEGKKIEDIMNNFSENDWNTVQTHASQKTKAVVGLPRFAVANYNVDLIPTLKKMGITDIFDPHYSDLTKISPPVNTTQLYVNLFKQFTYLKVDETGAEAAATTVTSLGPTAVPRPSVYCDHPFGIIISENTFNTILFMGRIMNPQSE